MWRTWIRTQLRRRAIGFVFQAFHLLPHLTLAQNTALPLALQGADAKTALHRAAMSGRAEAVRVLLAHGASVNALDGMFSATPLVWAVEGWSHGSRSGADHISVARLLVAAGSSQEWQAPEKAPDPEGTQEKLVELCRAAAVQP